MLQAINCCAFRHCRNTTHMRVNATFGSWGFQSTRFFATVKLADGKSPKADILNVLRPCAFVDDFLPYMSGVHPDIHLALILRNETGSPNTGEQLNKVTSTHRSLLDFARWWVGR